MRLLLIENDLILSDLLIDNLLKSYLVDFASNIQRIQTLFEENSYQAILLSSYIFSNYQLQIQAKKVFQKTQSPVLLMTGGEVSSFDFDFLGQRLIDFLHKPFSFNELNLRLASLLFKPLNENRDFTLAYQNLYLDNHSRFLSCDGRSLLLNRKEFYLLQLFFKRPEQLLSKSLLANLVWDNDEVVYSNTIATYLSSLRKKIKKVSGKDLIKAVRGSGYTLKN
jgi:DNA-binding response OmpR family regulator